MVHVWGMREEQNSKRARELFSNKAPREPMDAMRQMGLKWLSELLHTRTWLFEHCEAVLTPPGGGAVDYSPSRDPPTWPRATISVTPGAFLSPSGLWCVNSENVFGGLHVCVERSVRRCLSIVELS